MEVPIRNESNAFLKTEIILLHYVVVRLVFFDFFLLMHALELKVVIVAL